MKEKVWVVKEQQWESYVDGLGEDYAIVSIHKTKKGADDYAEALWKNNAISSLTGGEVDDINADPDKVIGALEDIDEPDMAEELKKLASVPGAVWADVVIAFSKKYHEDDIAGVDVDEVAIKD